MVMYFVMLLAHPKPSDAYGQIDGAYAACFVDAGSAAEAERQVRQALDAGGWDTEAVEELRVVTREQYAEDPDTLAKFDQALADGLMMTLHTWPVGAADED